MAKWQIPSFPTRSMNLGRNFIANVKHQRYWDAVPCNHLTKGLAYMRERRQLFCSMALSFEALVPTHLAQSIQCFFAFFFSHIFSPPDERMINHGCSFKQKYACPRLSCRSKYAKICGHTAWDACLKRGRHAAFNLVWNVIGINHL
jgi:hypothetical protein